MTKDEIIEWLEGEVLGYPERATGNECEDFIVRLARRVVEADRNALVGAMRDWISQRGKRTLLAVRIGAEHKLRELTPDIQRLLEEVRAGRAFSPYYEEFIVPALKRISNAENRNHAEDDR
jgi:hypothetical protein